MTPEDESRTDVAWREIVENYGERVTLESVDTTSAADPEPEPERGPEPEAEPAFEVEVESFRPPTAPPIALPSTWQRRVAWAGVFIAPLIGFVLAIFDVVVASAINWTLVAWFLGGFGYLVATMSDEPRDPWDNGSRV